MAKKKEEEVTPEKEEKKKTPPEVEAAITKLKAEKADRAKVESDLQKITIDDKQITENQAKGYWLGFFTVKPKHKEGWKLNKTGLLVAVSRGDSAADIKKNCGIPLKWAKLLKEAYELDRG